MKVTKETLTNYLCKVIPEQEKIIKSIRVDLVNAESDIERRQLDHQLSESKGYLKCLRNLMFAVTC